MPWRREARRETASHPKTAPSPSPGPALVWPSLETWAAALDATMLSEHTVKEAERFLQTYRRQTLPVRHAIALRLREAIAAEVNPPPPATVTSMDVIATALSARRRQLGLGDISN